MAQSSRELARSASARAELAGVGRRDVRHESQVILRITSVIARPMSGSAIWSAERDDDGAGDDAERDEAVDAGVVAVGDQRRAREPPPGAEPNLGGELVADEADHAGGREHPEVR